MIITHLNGPLHQQLGQYAYGAACASRLGVALKIDTQAPSLLDSFTLPGEMATKAEIAAATPVREGEAVVDGAWLDGVWAAHHYSAPILKAMMASLGLVQPPSNAVRALLEAIHQSHSVSLDLRTQVPAPGHVPLAETFLQDAIAELRERVPDARFFVLASDDTPAKLFGERADFVLVDAAMSDAEALLVMSSCRHHIVSYNSAADWAARLDPKAGALVIAPQHVYAIAPGVQQPKWPEGWIVFPTRVPTPSPIAVRDYQGGTSHARPMRVGFHCFYEHLTKDGFLFKNTKVTNGNNLLKPTCELYEYGQAHGIDCVTLDQVASMDELDAVVFSDRPKADSPLANAALAAPHLLKILITCESPLIKPDNWDKEYHRQFDYVFTWGEELVDGVKYIRNNLPNDLTAPFDLEVLQSAFEQRKLAMLINSAVLIETPNNFPNELYSHRLRAIRWFEANAPQDFDLYGMGWDVNMFPSYRGKVRDKLAVLSHYRFAICYENAMNTPGYITEKILDCLAGGTVPVYGGAPNIARWIPSDCFIDINQFASYDELYRHLKEMDAATHAGYLARIRRFLTSEQSYSFSSQAFVTNLTQYLAWGVQTRRGEVPEAAQRAGLHVNGSTHQLVQDKATMELRIEPKPQPTMQQLRSQIAALERPELIVCLGYGMEVETFVRARALWSFYASHFPRLKIIVMRDTDSLPRGEIHSEGNDIVIGTGGDRPRGPNWTPDGAWSAEANERTIYRQMAFYDHLLRKYDHNFILYGATITSVVDFRGVLAMMDKMPSTRVFAGMPGTLPQPPYQGVGMVHGANTCVSRDVMELMRARYRPGSQETKQPNDHWQGIVLPDVERTFLPLFSFNEPRTTGEAFDDIARLAGNLVRDGHYHFRIKTTSEAAGSGRREDVDPWIMLKIMEAILSTPSSPQAVWSLQERFSACCQPGATEPRTFPIDDSETVHFYR